MSTPHEVNLIVESFMVLSQDERDKKIWEDWYSHEAQVNQTGACNPEVWQGIVNAELAQHNRSQITVLGNTAINSAA